MEEPSEIPRTEKEKTWKVIEGNHEKRRKNAGELVRYLKRGSTVEELSLLGTEQGKRQGKKQASLTLEKKKLSHSPAMLEEKLLG